MEQRVTNRNTAGASAGETAVRHSGSVEVHVAELRQMFDAMDPSPFHDLDRLYDRLATMPVRIQYARAAVSDAWQRDWPAVSAGNARGLRDPQR